MIPRFQDIGAAERRSAIVLLAAFGLAALAASEPLGGVEGPASGVGLVRPLPEDGASLGAYASASPFDPARRPVAGVGHLPGEGEAMPAPPPPVVLLAGILVEGETRKAMFSGAGVWQEAGSMIGDWVLESVEPRRVRLRRGDQEMVLRSDEALR